MTNHGRTMATALTMSPGHWWWSAREANPGTDVAGLVPGYLGFTRSALDTAGRCHNRMGSDGSWLDAPGLGDWWGRAIWGLGSLSASSSDPALRAAALSGFRTAAKQRSPHTRALAFAALGAGEILLDRPAEWPARRLLNDAVAAIGVDRPDPTWPWPEARLRYSNGSIAEALLIAGQALPDPVVASRGLHLLDFLLRTETRDGHLSVTPVGGRGRFDVTPAFDQQPIEVAALADACARAFAMTADDRWRSGVRMAWAWFLGDNDTSIPMFDPQTGAGFDGLHRAAPQPQSGRRVHPGGALDRATRPTTRAARVIAQRLVAADLRADPERVIARLYLPGEESPDTQSRTSHVVARVLALPEDRIERLAARLVEEFADRHNNYTDQLDEHAAIIGSHLRQTPVMSRARKQVMGASFTAEYAVEAAALCNPSAVLHPDQSGLRAGQARLALSLRAIGEGHVSSLGFAAAVIGPGATWAFEPRESPAVPGISMPAQWARDHLRAVLADEGQVDELTHNVLAGLPEVFTASEVERVLADAHPELLTRPSAMASIEVLRRVMASAYEVSFPADLGLSQQVIFPSTIEERNGIEDARFVRFHDDGQVDYRATYTAYDGQQIAPRLLISPDLRTFRAHRLAGPAARNKGMALFPRRIDGRHWALCRSDGENTSVATSFDGRIWGRPTLVQRPQASWEVVQVGNCGSPIETDRGWLVLTHGVGPMRTYAVGAILLDLNDPTRVRCRLAEPLLEAGVDERDGYVPNVVYSCGGVVHDGRLWLPYGISDSRIGVAWASIDELLDAMIPEAP